MILSYTLSMPNRNSWNGKWSGEKEIYVRTRTYRSKSDLDRAIKIRERGSFFYNFGDGWGARINIEEVTSKEAAKLRRKSNGFCGYDWMINSIEQNGYITSDDNAEPEENWK